MIDSHAIRMLFQRIQEILYVLPFKQRSGRSSRRWHGYAECGKADNARL